LYIEQSGDSFIDIDEVEAYVGSFGVPPSVGINYDLGLGPAKPSQENHM